MQVRDLVFSANLKELNEMLDVYPALAHEEFSLPGNPATAHPLHRICDGVSSGFYSESTGIELARIFLNHGADLNFQQEAGKDSPLTAACSLRCDQLALEYIKKVPASTIRAVMVGQHCIGRPGVVVM